MKFVGTHNSVLIIKRSERRNKVRLIIKHLDFTKHDCTPKTYTHIVQTVNTLSKKCNNSLHAEWMIKNKH